MQFDYDQKYNTKARQKIKANLNYLRCQPLSASY